MDLNLITHWRPQPGRVVEWKVTDMSARAAAQAPVDPALPTTMQERHLRRARLAAQNGETQSPGSVSRSISPADSTGPP